MVMKRNMSCFSMYVLRESSWVQDQNNFKQRNLFVTDKIILVLPPYREHFLFPGFNNLFQAMAIRCVNHF